MKPTANMKTNGGKLPEIYRNTAAKVIENGSENNVLALIQRDIGKAIELTGDSAKDIEALGWLIHEHKAWKDQSSLSSKLSIRTDGVAAAFELIVEEIEAVAATIAEQGGKAFQDKTYDKAHQLSENGKSLQSFRIKVVDLLGEWQSGIDVTTRQRFSTLRTRHIRQVKPHTKGPRTRIRIIFDDGTALKEDYAADTFALALRKIGLERVEALGLTERNVLLVSDTKSGQYSQRRIDGKYIFTNTSTVEKKATLEQIAKKLGVSLKVEII